MFYVQLCSGCRDVTVTQKDTCLPLLAWTYSLEVDRGVDHMTAHMHNVRMSMRDLI